MQHARFRYWLLDTMLRVMVPGVQRVFSRTRQAAQDYSLKSLMDKTKRRERAYRLQPCRVGAARTRHQASALKMEKVISC